MYWTNFIHIYQPPTQTREIVEKVTNECYRKLVEILKKHPGGKLTVNINASLTEQLVKYGFIDVIEGLKELAQDKRIEFTGSAKYHPILPLIPENEIRRQIELNFETNRKYFGESYNPIGFFPPEMCYSERIAKIVKDMGFKWIIVDEISYSGKLGQAKNNKIYQIKDMDFFIFFKERPFSAGFTYDKYPTSKEFIRDLDLNENYYLLTGTDGEIYGHHKPGQERLLEDVWQGDIIKTATISELFDIYKDIEIVKPIDSSWSTWESEIEQGIPYPQWDYPSNEIHELQWELAYMAINLINRTSKNADRFNEARDLLDKGLHSCQWWWASSRPWWGTDMIDKGADQLYEAVNAINRYLKPEEINQAQSLKDKIKETARYWQESGKAEELKREYKKEFTEVTTELTFG